MFIFPISLVDAIDFVVVDTEQDNCYNNSALIPCPETGDPFFGQDAQYLFVSASYLNNNDCTITDQNTGLIWQKTPDLENKYTFAEATAGADTFSLAGYND